MRQASKTEPPSSSRRQLFVIGQNCHGNWVVQDQKGLRGGLFVDRDAALRFVRAESGNGPHPAVVVSGVLELDFNRDPRAAFVRRPGRAFEIRQRRIA